MEIFITTAIILIILLAGLVFLTKLADKTVNVFLMAGSAIGWIFFVCFAAFYLCMGWAWKSAEYKANILNKEYNTEYSTEEVFYGSEVIEAIRGLDRTRVDLNGSLINK